MCRFASGILAKLDVYSRQDLHSHTAIMEAFGITDDALNPNFVKYEIVPTGENLMDMEKWEFRLDQDKRPGWFNSVQDEHRARLNLAKLFPQGFPLTINVSGSLDLSSVTALPEGFAPQVGVSLNLSSVAALPEGFAPKVSGNLYLSSVTALPEGFSPKLGGSLDLGSVTALPKGFAPQVGGYLNLRSVTGLPKGFSPKVGDSLNLSSVAALPEGFAPKVGGYLHLDSYKGPVPAGVKVGRQVLMKP